MFHLLAGGNIAPALWERGSTALECYTEIVLDLHVDRSGQKVWILGSRAPLVMSKLHLVIRRLYKGIIACRIKRKEQGRPSSALFITSSALLSPSPALASSPQRSICAPHCGFSLADPPASCSLQCPLPAVQSSRLCRPRR